MMAINITRQLIHIVNSSRNNKWVIYIGRQTVLCIDVMMMMGFIHGKKKVVLKIYFCL